MTEHTAPTVNSKTVYYLNLRWVVAFSGYGVRFGKAEAKNTPFVRSILMGMAPFSKKKSPFCKGLFCLQNIHHFQKTRKTAVIKGACSACETLENRGIMRFMII